MKQIDETLLKALKIVIKEIIDEEIKKYISKQNLLVSYRGIVRSVYNDEEENLPIKQNVVVSIEKLAIEKIFPNYTSLLLTEGSVVEIQCPGDDIRKGYINTIITSQ